MSNTNDFRRLGFHLSELFVRHKPSKSKRKPKPKPIKQPPAQLGEC